jgi:hypothetical protein
LIQPRTLSLQTKVSMAAFTNTHRIHLPTTLSAIDVRALARLGVLLLGFGGAGMMGIGDNQEASELRGPST